MQHAAFLRTTALLDDKSDNNCTAAVPGQRQLATCTGMSTFPTTCCMQQLALQLTWVCIRAEAPVMRICRTSQPASHRQSSAHFKQPVATDEKLCTWHFGQLHNPLEVKAATCKLQVSHRITPTFAFAELDLVCVPANTQRQVNASYVCHQPSYGHCLVPRYLHHKPV